MSARICSSFGFNESEEGKSSSSSIKPLSVGPDKDPRGSRLKLWPEHDNDNKKNNNNNDNDNNDNNHPIYPIVYEDPMINV